MAHFTSCADVWIAHGDMCPALFALMDQAQHVACVATEAVEPRDNQRVTVAQDVEHGCAFGATNPAPARDLLRSKDRAASGFQPAELQFEILIDGAATGVSDTGHV